MRNLCLFFCLSSLLPAQAAMLLVEIDNQTPQLLKAGETQVIGGGYLLDALNDMQPYSTGSFTATRSWYTPPRTTTLQATFFITDNNNTPRESCLIQLHSPRFSGSEGEFYAHCQPITPFHQQSARFHFDNNSLVILGTVKYPEVHVQLQEGPGNDLAVRFTLAGNEDSPDGTPDYLPLG